MGSNGVSSLKSNREFSSNLFILGKTYQYSLNHFGLCWNSIVRFSSNELRVEVRLYGHSDIPQFEGGQVQFLDKD